MHKFCRVFYRGNLFTLAHSKLYAVPICESMPALDWSRSYTHILYIWSREIVRHHNLNVHFALRYWLFFSSRKVLCARSICTNLWDAQLQTRHYGRRSPTPRCLSTLTAYHRLSAGSSLPWWTKEEMVETIPCCGWESSEDSAVWKLKLVSNQVIFQPYWTYSYEPAVTFFDSKNCRVTVNFLLNLRLFPTIYLSLGVKIEIIL